MNRSMPLVTLTLGAALMAGCGAPNGQAVQPESALVASNAYAIESPDATGSAGFPMRGMVARGLQLTEAQQGQIAALMDRHRPAKVDHAARLAELKQLLTASTVDVQALTAFLDARTSEARTRAKDGLAMMAEIREVLTPVQRQRAASFLGRDPMGGRPGFGRHGGPQGPGALPMHLLAGLGLTTDQQKALDALKTHWQSAAPDRAAMKSAMQAFIDQGDTSALQTQLDARPQAPTGDIATFIASLSSDQRTKLASELDHLGEGHGRGGERHRR